LLKSTHSKCTYLNRTNFFHIAYIQAPTFKRYKWRNDKLSLEQFLELDEWHSFNELTGSNLILKNADHIITNTGSHDKFIEAVETIPWDDTKLMRPDWDSYFMKVARLVALRSNCIRRAVGCVLVRDHRIISTGYNGAPFGIKNCCEGGCPRCCSSAKRGTSLDLCICMHSEEGAVIEAGREKCKDATIYTSLFPCSLCAKVIIQAGITKVVYGDEYFGTQSQELFDQAKVVTVKHK